MTLDTIVAIANIASVALAAGAIALGFFVRATANSTIDKKCTAMDAKIDGVEKAADAKIESAIRALSEKINANHDRITRMEGMVDDMPRVSDVHSLSLQLSAMAGDLKALGVKMSNIEEANKGYRSAISRIEGHLFKIET